MTEDSNQSSLDRLDDLVDQDAAGEDVDTVLDVLLSELDPERFHGLTATRRDGDTIYLVVSQTTTQHTGAQALDLRTCVVDLDDESVSILDNGLWVPLDSDVSRSLTDVLVETTAQLRGNGSETPAVESAVDDFDVEELLGTPVSEGRGGTSDEDVDDWETPPDEIWMLRERFEDAGIPTEDRFVMLNFGGKFPFGDEHHLGDASDMKAQYGVYSHADDPLVILDVDDLEGAEGDVDRLPETLRVSSPHGPDDRAHHYLRLDDADDVERLREEFGKLNPHPHWGEIRVDAGYVVGPGSQLDGCDKDDCTGDPPCSDPDGGRYEIIDDREIATVDVETLIDMLRDSHGVAGEESDEDDEETVDRAEDDRSDDSDHEAAHDAAVDSESDERDPLVRVGQMPRDEFSWPDDAPQEHQLDTSGVRSEVLDEDKDVVGHIVMLDYDDEVEDIEQVRADAEDLDGPSVILKSSEGRYHAWNLRVRHVDEALDAARSTSCCQTFVEGMADEGRFVLRTDAKIRRTGETYRDAPEVLDVEVDAVDGPVSAPHLEILADMAEDPVAGRLRSLLGMLDDPVGDSLLRSDYETMTDELREQRLADPNGGDSDG
jgi:hypothetical protein